MAYPDNPFIGQTIEVGGTTKQWNGYAWVNITNGNKELRLRFAEKSAALMTLAEAQADDTLKVGQYIRLTDRVGVYGMPVAQVVTGETPNNLDIINLDGTKSLKVISNLSDPTSLGAKINSETDATHNTSAIKRCLELVGAVNLGYKDWNYFVDGWFQIGFRQFFSSYGGYLTQVTDNSPTIRLTSSRFEFSNVRIVYKNQQGATDTQGIGVVFDGCFEAKVCNIQVDKGYQGYTCNNMADDGLGGLVWDNKSFCYMMDCSNLRSLDAYSWGGDISNDGSIGMTTNRFHNCYSLQTANNNTNTASRGWFISSQVAGLEFSGACDKIQGGIALLLSSCFGAKITQFDIESGKYTNATGVVRFDSCSNVEASVYFDVNTFTGNSSLLLVSGTSGDIRINGREKATTVTSGTLTGVTSTSTAASTKIEALDFVSDSSLPRSDGLNSNSKRTIFSWSGSIYAERTGVNTRREYSTVINPSATYNIGDTIVNNTPTRDRPIVNRICIAQPRTFAVTEYVIFAGNTGQRPALTNDDIGVKYNDTTVGAIVEWTGAGGWV